MANKKETTTDGNNLRLLLLMTLWSAAVLLLMSIDSPLHGGYNHLDSGWFFMCGKAVMNGLQPYVEFSDSKGPLLWLVYGVGYLLSPHTYHGVYVMGVLFYAGTFYYNFKTARLLLGDDRRAWVVTLLMPMVYFQYWFYYEFRAEDFCNLFVAASMYFLFAAVYGSGGATAHSTGGGVAAQQGGRPTARRCGLVLGGCFMALVMVKYSIAVMQGSMVAVALWYWLWVRGDYGFVKWLAAGMAAVALPFVGWLASVGSLSAFIGEYFVNTLRTVSSDKGLAPTLLHEIAQSWGTVNSQALLLLTVLGGWLLSRRLERCRYVPLGIALFFFLIATRHNMNYYYAACYMFVIYLFIYIAGLSSKPLSQRAVVAAVAVVIGWGVFENVRDLSYIGRTAVWADNKDRQNYERLSANITGDKPTMMTLFAGEFGFGMKAGALPAGKYWCRQVGSTPEMDREHLALLRSGRADYVVAYNAALCRSRGLSTELIRSYGYEPCDSLTYVDYKNHRRTTIVYRKVAR